ncbi:NUDIX hydrolase [Candidatus Saccharibacteria bacterium]|nr:NUDIX hydrolase [Candidatus Saccharibacteria bacterium]
MKRILRLIGTVAFWTAWPVWWVYFRIGCRTRVVIEHDGKILVVQNWLGAGRWILPGGGLHREENPGIGAAREVYEETGIKLEPKELRLIGKGKISHHGFGYKYVGFYAEMKEAVTLKPQRLEVAKLTWMTPSELSPGIASKDTLVVLDEWQQRR